MHRFLSACSSALALLFLALPATGSAQGYPNKPIQIIVPSTTGSNTSLVARVYANLLSNELGQPVVVEDKPGAGGVIATKYVMSRPADGYTLLAMSGTFLTAPSSVPDAGYDPVRDFVGVSQTAELPLVLVVNSELPAKTVKELIDMGKARPGALSYGSVGTGSFTDMANMLFARTADINVLGVPYKGTAPALMDLLANRISFMMDPINTSAPHIRAGKLRVLAVTTGKRSPAFPDVPTMKEAGVAGYELPVFNGIAVRAGTPPAIVQRLHAAIAKVAAPPEVRDTFLKDGQLLVASKSSAEFDSFIKAETARMNDILKMLAK